MFTKTNRNDPLVESIKNVMEQNDLLRRVESAVNEHFGVVSKKALPHEYHAEYDAIFEETKKCAMAEEDKSKKAETPEHHRAEAIRAHKAIKISGKLPHLVAKKKEHEEAYRKMTGNKIKYPEDLDEKVKMTKAQMANLDGDPKFTGNDLAHLRAGTHKKKAAAGELEEEKMTSSEKKKEKKLKAKYDPSGMKKSMIGQYGKEKGKNIYFATIRKKAMNESIDTILEEIRNNLEEQLVYVYENYDEATFNDYVASLTEEQIDILGLNEVSNVSGKAGSNAGIADRVTGTAKRLYRAATGGETQSTMGSSQNTQTPSGGGINANAGRQYTSTKGTAGSNSSYATRTKAAVVGAMRSAVGGAPQSTMGSSRNTQTPSGGSINANAGRLSTSTGMVAGPGTRISPEQSAKLAAQKRETPQPKSPGSLGTKSGANARQAQRPNAPAARQAQRPNAPAARQAQRPNAPAARQAQRPGMKSASTGEIANRAFGIQEEIYNNLAEEIMYVYENYNEATFNEYVANLSEEQLEIIGLDEGVGDDISGMGSRVKAWAQNKAGEVSRAAHDASAWLQRKGANALDAAGLRTVAKDTRDLGDRREKAGIESQKSWTQSADKTLANAQKAGTVDPKMQNYSQTQRQQPGTPTATQRQRTGTPTATQRQRTGTPTVKPKPRVPGGAAAAAQKRGGYSTAPKNATAGDMMNRAYGIQEEYDAPKPIKESFEQFVRRFLKD